MSALQTTADWLRSIGYHEDDTGCYLIQEDERGWLLAFLLDDAEPGGVVTKPGSVSWRGDDMLETCRIATQGEVLRLMHSLGIDDFARDSWADMRDAFLHDTEHDNDTINWALGIIDSF